MAGDVHGGYRVRVRTGGGVHAVGIWATGLLVCCYCVVGVANRRPKQTGLPRLGWPGPGRGGVRWRLSLAAQLTWSRLHQSLLANPGPGPPPALIDWTCQASESKSPPGRCCC